MKCWKKNTFFRQSNFWGRSEKVEIICKKDFLQICPNSRLLKICEFQFSFILPGSWHTSFDKDLDFKFAPIFVFYSFFLALIKELNSLLGELKIWLRVKVRRLSKKHTAVQQPLCSTEMWNSCYPGLDKNKRIKWKRNGHFFHLFVSFLYLFSSGLFHLIQMDTSHATALKSLKSLQRPVTFASDYYPALKREIAEFQLVAQFIPFLV